MVSIASSLCSPEAKYEMSPPAAAATSSLVISGLSSGPPIVPKSTTSVSTPSASMSPFTKANSAPLVSSAPMMTTVFELGLVLMANLYIGLTGMGLRVRGWFLNRSRPLLPR